MNPIIKAAASTAIINAVSSIFVLLNKRKAKLQE
ncbi:hypothetical protein KCTC52924_02175 [Arenibacter antarcticus]